MLLDPTPDIHSPNQAPPGQRCPSVLPFLPVLGPNLECSEHSKKDRWTNKLMVQKEGGRQETVGGTEGGRQKDGGRKEVGERVERRGRCRESPTGFWTGCLRKTCSQQPTSGALSGRGSPTTRHGKTNENPTGFPGSAVLKKSPANAGDTQTDLLGQEDPPEEGMATHSSILAWKFHGERSLTGWSPGGHKEPDTTERLITHTHKHTHMHNENPINSWLSHLNKKSTCEISYLLVTGYPPRPKVDYRRASLCMWEVHTCLKVVHYFRQFSLKLF